MTTTKINTALLVAKCCLGDLTCRITQKAMFGQGYTKTMYIGMELSLYIFAIESYLLWSAEDCMVEVSEIDKITQKISKLCGCDCTSAASVGGTSTGEYTVEEHTTLEHTI